MSDCQFLCSVHNCPFLKGFRCFRFCHRNSLLKNLYLTGRYKLHFLCDLDRRRKSYIFLSYHYFHTTSQFVKYCRCREGLRCGTRYKLAKGGGNYKKSSKLAPVFVGFDTSKMLAPTTKLVYKLGLTGGNYKKSS